MPRQTFLDTILNRPSQSYAPSTPEKRSKSNQSKWSTPSDLPNAPRQPDSILAGSMFQSGSNSLGRRSGMGSISGAMSAGVGGGGGGSTFGRSSFSSRFGRKKNRRDSISESDAGMSDFGGGTSIADSQATFSKKKYSRWWNPSGSKKKNYAGSVADSIFSEPAQEGQMPGGWDVAGTNNIHSMVGVGAGNSKSLGRGTRSDYGGESSNRLRASVVPPLPHHDPAALKAWSSASNLTSGVGGTSIPLAQSPPPRTKKSSKSKRISSYAAQEAQIHSSPSSQLAHAEQRKKLASNSSPNLDQQSFQNQVARSPSSSHRKSAHGGSQEWKKFVEGMKGTETAKAWEGGSHGQGFGVVSVANSSNNVARRKSVVERLQRELEQDAQFDQNQSSSSNRNGDLLQRAAAHVVGDTQSYPLAADGSGEYENNRNSSDQMRNSHIPTGIQPGSVIPPLPHSNNSSPKKRESRTMPGGMGVAEESSSEEEDDAQSPSTAIPSQHHQANTASREGETSGSGESSSEEDEDEDSRLDVLPEEDEDSSSAGGHEMKPRPPIGPHLASPGRTHSPVGRLSAFEAALKRSAPVEPPRTEVIGTGSTPAVVVNGINGKREEHSSEEEEEGEEEEGGEEKEEEMSPPVPPKEISSSPASIPVYPTASTPAPKAGSTKQDAPLSDTQASSIPADGGSLGLHSTSTTPTTEDVPDAQSSRGVKFDAASTNSARRPSSLMVRRASDNASKKSEGSDEVLDDGASSRAPSTRPATLRRRLSDLSLGGSFAFSQIMRSADGSRSITTGKSSSRKIKMRDDDEDSIGGSGSEGDDDLRERAKKEQDRLRNIKVGEDFFGPSLTGIFDSLESKDWDTRTLDRVGGLDLAGTSTSKKRESGQLLLSSPGSEQKDGRIEPPTTRNLTADEQIAVSAQERMTEIRRQRAEGVQNADAESQATGLAPSFAALWLLQNADSKDEASPPVQVLPRSSSITSATAPVAANVPFASPKGRFSSLFSSSSNAVTDRPSLDSDATGTATNSPVSVLNRPRQKAAKPTEMGGVAISQGKLAPDSPVVVEDNRSTLPRPVSSVKVGETSPTSSSSASFPSSPTLGKSSTSNGTLSKDKPAPAKSALKNKKSSAGLKGSKSLADTLFSLPLLGSSAEKEQKKEEKKEKARRASVSKDKAPPSSWASKESKVAKLERKASQKSLQAAALASSNTPKPAAPKAPQPTKTISNANSVGKTASPSSPDSSNSAFSSPNSIPSISAFSPSSELIVEKEVSAEKGDGEQKGKGRQAEEEIGDDSLEKDEFHPSLSTLDTKSLAPQSLISSAFFSATSPSSPQTEAASPTDQFSTPLASPALEMGQEQLGNDRERSESEELDLSFSFDGDNKIRRKYVTAKDLVGMTSGQNEGEAPTEKQADPNDSTNKEQAGSSAADGFGMSSLGGSFSLAEFSVPKLEPKEAEPQANGESEQAAEAEEESDSSDEEEEEERKSEPKGNESRNPEPSSSGNSKSPVVSPRGPPSEMWSEPSGSSSTSVTTPGTSEVVFGASVSPTMKAREWAARNPPVITKESEKRLPMPPPPTFSDALNEESVQTPTEQDRTPMAIDKGEPSFGVNLIPPTPPALENRQSFNASRPPSGSVLAPLTEEALEGSSNKPNHLKRSTSSSSKTSKATLTRTRSSSSTSRRKSAQPIVEYDGKGMLNLPAGLVATTVASSGSRRKSSDEAAIKASQPSAGSSTSDGGPSPVKRKSKKSSKHGPPEVDRSLSPEKRTSRSYSSFDTTGAPGVPPIPGSMRSEVSSSPSMTGSYPSSSAGSDGGGSVSPAPSSSGRASVSMASETSSRDLSPAGVRYPKKIRTLSAGPTARPQLRMSAINEWESSAALSADSPSHRSPANSSPASPYLEGSPGQNYPPLPASTISRTSSAGSGVTPSVVRNAPLGASTNAYLHPPIPRSRRSLDMSAHELEEEAPRRPSSRAAVSLDGHSAPRDWHSIAPSNASANSLASQSAASLPAVPLSSYRPHKDPVGAAGTIDERLYARTTMSTVTISSGAFANKSKSLRKRSSVQENVNGSGTASNRGSLDIPDHLQDELNQTTISLTAHTPPPRKISSTQVLVQIIAVAIDEMDRLLLREKIRTETAYGFVPGRSFCGRVMEAGWDVKRMRKGDIIFGLQDSRKCGALAEFMTIDQELIAKAPEDCLTTEQIAALPFTGVMAYQIMQNHCSMLPRGARVLVLNAHDGIGLLTMQECASLSLIIVAQCPPSVSDAVAVCEANGAHEVVIGEPLWALNSLHESSFDLVIDTIGGRRVYDAARRILAHDGQFATCFGDEHSMANPTLRSHLRSLRRSFFKKDKKNIGYEWIGAETGEDCRQALEAVKMAAEKGDICPRLSSILPFADAPRAFDPVIRRVEEEPGAVVVRVS